MYTIYESSLRRSPRHNPTPSENSLKPKSNSPIRKSSKNSVGNVPKSAGALAAITRQKPRKRKVNDENKENCRVVTRPARTGGLGVNGSVGKASQPLPSKVEVVGRLPLKELPLNGFVERLSRRDVVPTVEIVVLFPVVMELIIEYCGSTRNDCDERKEREHSE